MPNSPLCSNHEHQVNRILVANLILVKCNSRAHPNSCSYRRHLSCLHLWPTGNNKLFIWMFIKWFFFFLFHMDGSTIRNSQLILCCLSILGKIPNLDYPLLVLRNVSIFESCSCFLLEDLEHPQRNYYRLPAIGLFRWDQV